MTEGAAPQDPRWQETCLRALSVQQREPSCGPGNAAALPPDPGSRRASPGRGSSRVFVFSFLQVADVSRALGPLSPVGELCPARSLQAFDWSLGIRADHTKTEETHSYSLFQGAHWGAKKRASSSALRAPQHCSARRAPQTKLPCVCVLPRAPRTVPCLTLPPHACCTPISEMSSSPSGRWLVQTESRAAWLRGRVLWPLTLERLWGTWRHDR